MHTVAGELAEYIEQVKQVTECEKVALVGFSQGTCAVMTYLYENYYTKPGTEIADSIDSVILLCGAYNGVAACGDPLSGNAEFDTLSLLRYLKTVMSGNAALSGLYYMVEFIASTGILEPVIDTLNDYMDKNFQKACEPYLLSTFGSFPGFYAMFSYDVYKNAEDVIFSTPELQTKYAGLIEKNRYYHENVQKNNENIINKLLSDGRNVAIIAEYGFPIAPATSDNDRMTDFSICTTHESFGATCSDVDGILGLDYKQKVSCTCAKNHLSADLQIDASTCLFPDITWFGKGLKHDAGTRFWGDLIDLIVFSDEQITVWTFENYPQFMENYNDECLVPLTNEDKTYATAFEDSMIFGKLLFGNGGSI